MPQILCVGVGIYAYVFVCRLCNVFQHEIDFILPLRITPNNNCDAKMKRKKTRFHSSDEQINVPGFVPSFDCAVYNNAKYFPNRIL